MIGAIVSACYGDWDDIKALPAQDGATLASAVMVTDNPDLIGRCPGWTVWVEPRPHMHPCLAAKVPKFRTDLYAPDVDYTVWVDASATIDRDFLAMCANSVAPDAPEVPGLATFPHPHRVSLYDEVACSRTLRKYDMLPLEAQVSHYIDRGYPDPCILRASGCIVRRDPRSVWHKSFGDRWLQECVRWGFQDQLSLSYLLWEEGMIPADIGPSLFTNDHITFGPHRA